MSRPVRYNDSRIATIQFLCRRIFAAIIDAEGVSNSNRRKTFQCRGNLKPLLRSNQLQKRQGNGQKCLATMFDLLVTPFERGSQARYTYPSPQGLLAT